MAKTFKVPISATGWIGNLISTTDNTADIGTAGGNRFRRIYAVTDFVGPIGATTPSTGVFTGLTINSITGSVQCLHVNSSETVSGSGADCGAGGGGGSVTSVSGTANQITVVSGSTTPTLSIPATFTFPGTVTNNLSIFGATTSAQLLGVLSDETGSGLAVFGTSPTIVTPTIASFTNATHTHQNAAGGGTLDAAALASGIIAATRMPAFTGDCTTSSGAVAVTCGAAIGRTGNPLSQFAATTSAQLAGVLSDESGSGVAIFQTNPTIITPTIASFTNATHTHLNAAGGGTLDTAAIATGTWAAARMPAFTGDCTTSSGAVAITCGSAIGRTGDPLSQFASTTSAQLLGMISDETGSGAAVFGTSPTIVTPTIASFASATHNHQNAAGGGTLDV